MSTSAGPREATILIVDDDPDQLVIIERVLEREGYGDLTSTGDPRDALELFESERFDLAIVDLKMPGIDGIQLAKRFRQLRPPNETAILILTAVDNDKVVAHLLSEGLADEYLKKPFHPGEFCARVRLLLTRLPSTSAVAPSSPLDAGRLLESNGALRATVAALASCLTKAIAYREEGGGGERAQRRAALSARLALALGWSEDEAEELRLAALIHDLGKLGIPDTLVVRRAALSDKEMALFREQPLIGAEWLTNVAPESPPPLMTRAAAAARGHCEHWDGSGFPANAAGASIPIEARIIAIAEALERLFAQDPEQAAAHLAEGAGRRFDPELVDVAQHHLGPLLEAWKAACPSPPEGRQSP